ncbi:hypothetical protein L2164_13340 [Pectobacterium brasiliense]|uniref:Uncharacterized protein n=1 Tax=Pectobacterium odoriferum TaxID=78398 RepID=A0ABR4VVU1_9GAMM|nr:MULTISPECIES: hypothetical protein [Pectobacterium]KGA43406.1 hypothetical protein KU75_01470 [Pectobacterium odoriferum]MCG5049680.1 hypothetical protein [Pectobacterium brasiliense]
MNCLIKHSLSFVVESVVKRLIEDVNEYSYLLTTEDWRLLMSLDKSVGERQICQKQCLGCLECARMVAMLSSFINGILSANREAETLVTELCSIFGIPDDSDPIVLALDLVVSPDYVKSKIPEKTMPAYEAYVGKIKGEVISLALDHFQHEQAKCNDTILAYANLEQKQIIAYEPIEIPVEKEVFYVDQNVVSKYGDDQNFSRQIENFKSKVDCKFVYSPYVIEDGVKMSRVRLTEYFEAIKALTDNTMLVRSESGVMLAREDIKVTFDRVLLWRNATRAAEDLKVQKMHFNHWGYSHYSRGSKLSGRANKNIDEFLDSLRPYLDDNDCDFDFNDYESDHALCQRLSAATIEKSFSLEELVDKSIKYEDDAECMRHIEHLCDFLDLINYQTEPLSELSKIRSSLQDTEHLKHAWKADYFVTDDKRLRIRGAFIYSVLGLSTKFISSKELKERVVSEFKE